MFVGKEVKTFKEGVVDTPGGVFYPLYETHDIGVEAENIPEGLDAFFREFALKQSGFTDKPTDLFNKKFKDEKGQEYGRRNMEFPVLKKLAQDQTKLVYGDLLPAFDINTLLDERWEAKLRRMQAGGLVAVSGSMYIGLTKLLDRISHTKPTNETLSRRKFLVRAIAPLALVLEAPLIQGLIDLGESGLYPSFDQKNAAQRVIQRINTLLSSLEPEDHAIFFRSVVMADKILTVAEAIQQETGKKPHMAFQVGAKHSGIEDLLLAGHNFNRLILASYPKDFLEKMMKITGGAENFSTARVFTLNPTMTPEGMDSGNDEQVVVKEEKIVDKPLLQTLSSVLTA